MQLGEVTMSELFERDPKDISDEEFEQIIAWYRAERTKLVQSDAEGKRATPKRAAKAKVTKESLGNVSLKDLGLE